MHCLGSFRLATIWVRIAKNRLQVSPRFRQDLDAERDHSKTATSGSVTFLFLGVTLSGDGNIAGISNGFSDPSGNAVGSLARPEVQFPGMIVTSYPLNNYPSNTLLRPRLNTSGSLYY